MMIKWLRWGEEDVLQILLMLPVEVPIETEWSITCGYGVFKYTSLQTTDAKRIQPLSLSFLLSPAVPPAGLLNKQDRPSRGNSRLPVFEKEGKKAAVTYLVVDECYRHCLSCLLLHSLSITVRCCLSLPFTFHQLVEHVHTLIALWALSGRAGT